MYAHVLSQSALLRERSSTNFTFARLLASMRAKMNCQIALLIKRFSANFTFERLLASMLAKMNCQFLCTRTRFIARSTHVWCDEHVRSRVNGQMALLIALSHTVHLNGFSPVCVRRCSVKWPFVLNALSHSLHLNGFSPICIRL